MISYESIRSVHLEISTRCNASCPDCMRNYRGVNNVINTYPVTDMRLEQFKTIFKDDFIRQLNHVYINGNYGDFVTAQDGIEIVKHLRILNPTMNIVISTNASAKSDIWSDLGKLKVDVCFRLDGLEDTHKLYRLGTDFNSIIYNAKRFIEAGGIAQWHMILFDHNKHQISACRALAKQLGFSSFNIVNEGRNTFPVFFQNRKLSHVVGNYLGSLDFDTLYQNSLEYQYEPDYTNKKISCYSKQNKQIYVSANGEVYPCCWLGFYPLISNCQPSNSQLRPLIKDNNALVYGLKKSIEWFNSIEDTWQYPSPAQGRMYACNNVCGK